MKAGVSVSAQGRQPGYLTMRRIALCLLALWLHGTAANAWPNEQALEQELGRLAQLPSGTLGVAVVHVESGRSAFVNADEPYPMASTFKVPVAVQLLHLVDEQSLRLDRMIDLAPADLAPGSGMITSLLDDPGVSLSLRNLLELMLLISDNTAADLMLREAGGPDAVNARLRALGVEGMRVDRSTLSLIADALGTAAPAPESRTRAGYETLFDALPEDAVKTARAAFAADPRDTSSPRAMAELLAKIWRGQALSDASTALLIDIMSRCQTGQARLKGMLPIGTEVAHKTGTIAGSANDVGVITLPHDAGHVIVAAFVKGSDAEMAARERAIADVARAAHDYFLFAPQATAR